MLAIAATFILFSQGLVYSTKFILLSVHYRNKWGASILTVVWKLRQNQSFLVSYFSFKWNECLLRVLWRPLKLIICQHCWCAVGHQTWLDTPAEGVVRGDIRPGWSQRSSFSCLLTVIPLPLTYYPTDAWQFPLFRLLVWYIYTCSAVCCKLTQWPVMTQLRGNDKNWERMQHFLKNKVLILTNDALKCGVCLSVTLWWKCGCVDIMRERERRTLLSLPLQLLFHWPQQGKHLHTE